MEYNHKEVEQRCQKYWAENGTYKVHEDVSKEKFYVLDMFPYPSGAGLHVGHPLGYIASDIYARYKRLEGYNVLHPMGYDSFGLPAEQYAIQTGQHPAVTTKTNIEGVTDKDGNVIPGYRKQLDQIGFSFDWSREVRTSDPSYYKWTQWIFKQLFNSWYNKAEDKAQSIDLLIAHFEANGSDGIKAVCDEHDAFTAAEWKAFDEKKQQEILLYYRLAFLADSWVNWCPALGTVLANDEVKDGVSERGGHPVEQKLMRQWSLRITAYAGRLLQGLDKLDWSDALKDQQRNWIGKSKGASVKFKVDGFDDMIEVFTTRPDTIFGVNFMVLAPEHELVSKITTADCKEKVDAYVQAAALKSERDRQSDVKNITGEFTGAYAIHPFTGDKVQIWIGDYVLASYGTGAVMAVPCGDQRDWDFAKHFNIEIKNIFKDVDISEAAYAEKDAVITDSDFLNDLPVKKAIGVAIKHIMDAGIGVGKTNYRLRDAVFSRQRYWGEPFPVYYKDEMPYVLEGNYHVELPEVDKFLPTEDGDPPLGNADKWSWCINKKIVKDNDQQNGTCTFPLELNTMPGWAGSSWYFLRYMDPCNEKEFVAKDKADYWGQVDLYIGGSEHAVGHLLYSRFWTKFLYDLGHISFDEPFKKLINQGMILGRSSFVYRLIPHINNLFSVEKETIEKAFSLLPPVFISYSHIERYKKEESLTQDESENLGKIKRQLVELGEKMTANVQEKLNDFNLPISYTIQEYVNQLHVDISLVQNDELDIEGFKKWREEYKDAEFILEDGKYICGHEVEKMSKSKYNVQTPDELVDRFGADTLRCYEMFLGPLEQSKPWDTQGINGVSNFLRKFWRLFHNDELFAVSDGEADKKSLKTLHKTIKKIKEDLDRFSFNTVVSAAMIAVNELTDQKCNNRDVLEKMVIILSPYAPHICEELWAKLGHKESVTFAQFPEFIPAHLEDSSYAYPVSFNGKMRFKLELPTTLSKEEIEKEVMANEQTAKYLDGKDPKKVIVVPKKIVNVVM